MVKITKKRSSFVYFTQFWKEKIVNYFLRKKDGIFAVRSTDKHITADK